MRPRVPLLLTILFVTSFSARAQTVPPQENAAEQTPNKESGQNKPSLLTPLKPVTVNAAYQPITSRQRLRWFLTNTIGPPHLVGGLFTSAFGTAVDRPKEYGPGWAGFGDRYGMGLLASLPETLSKRVREHCGEKTRAIFVSLLSPLREEFLTRCNSRSKLAGVMATSRQRTRVIWPSPVTIFCQIPGASIVRLTRTML